MKGITVDAVVTAVTARLSLAPASPAGRREEVVT